MDDDLNTILRDARRFVEFCNGLEEAGLLAYAQRGRRLADATIRLVAELKAMKPLTAQLASWRSSLLICGQCKRLVVTAGDEGGAARAAFEEGDVDGTAH